MAHIQLLLGETDQARKYYVEAAGIGHTEESNVGIKACVEDEEQLARLSAGLLVCRRAWASTGGGSSSSAQLKHLLSTLSIACKRTPHHLPLLSLRAEALSASGRMTEAQLLCEEQLASPPAHTAHTAVWLYTLARVLYDSSILPEAAEKLAESLQRFHAPSQAKPLARLVQRLESERCKGNDAFKRGEWATAIDAYTRALAVDPAHARFNAILYCNRGAAHAKDGSLQQALADFSAAIALNRSYAKAYLRRGELRARCCDNARAIEDFAAAHRLDANGAVGVEASRRISMIHKESVRERASTAKASNARGWDRARAGFFPNSSTRAPGRSGGRDFSFSFAKKPDYYGVLGIASGASIDEIRKAYKKMCLKYHPDKYCGSDKEKEKAKQCFVDVQKAHEVLSNETQRRIYDVEYARAQDARKAVPRYGCEDNFSCFRQKSRP